MYLLTKLAQPLMQGYLHTVNPDIYMPQCPLCLTHTHDTNHLCNGTQVPTEHHAINL